MILRKILFSLILLFLLNACCWENRNAGVKNTPPINKLKQMDWLPGSWANLSDEGNFYENWTRLNDSVYEAFSYMTITGDTVFSETVILKVMEDGLYYVVSASSQNEDQPVSFKLVSSENDEFVFENKAHDFPQRIIYKHPATDSIHARIEGTINGKFSSEEFPMKRYHQ